MRELVFLLLPVAAFSGWWIGRRNKRESWVNCSSILNQDYYSGLNYLLNEQPDKAVEAFLKLLDTSDDSVETALALGNVFRRRGEVDRAIRIHQNLIARPNLTRRERARSLVELGRDYMRAGVYDRAENLFIELTKTSSDHLDQSLRHLIDIYEREKDWSKAIVAAQKMQKVSGHFMGKEIAHYFCEIAQWYWERGNSRSAIRQLKFSLSYDKTCVRASILQGQIERKMGRIKPALKAYKRVQFQDPVFLSEVIDDIVFCYQELGSETRLLFYLEQLMVACPNMSVALASSKYLEQRQGRYAGIKNLIQFLHQYPSIQGLRHLILFKLDLTHGQEKERLHTLKKVMDKMVENKPHYRCESCGFSSKTLHWHCPSCRQWAVVKPMASLEGGSL